ncbi:hypothetical protein PSQ19_15255 [Devosia algicola]|uniref:Uncharacterized protein n=1 Tax=Devosia algicola TaxID=3026418 RepID=A0ABY7YM56_9HYPH|nr:hypothetical protein [Devosia algicola]WDR02025.1 hypothetical protein PSQ19_15255 [Devosia algicola]
MPDKMTKITRPTAQRHEAIFLRLTSLTKQAEAAAARRPGGEVPDGVRMVAEGLLFDCRPFLVRSPGRALPVAAPVYGALAAQLGQALAGLVAFEARCTSYDGQHNCYVWHLGDNGFLPVQRLRPQLPPPPPASAKDNTARIRAKLARRIEKILAGRTPTLMAKTYPPSQNPL